MTRIRKRRCLTTKNTKSTKKIFWEEKKEAKIEIISQEWGEILPLARRFERSAYAAAYLALAEKTGEPLVTGDARLFNAVHAELGWVVWIGEYETGCELIRGRPRQF